MPTRSRGWPHRHPPNIEFRSNRASEQSRGLVGWWPLRTPGNVVRDRADGVYPANTFGGSWTQDGQRGSALSFNGTSDIVYFGDVLDMGADSFSTTCWVRASTALTTTAGTGGRVLQKRGTGISGSFAGWTINVYRVAAGEQLWLSSNSPIDDGVGHSVVPSIVQLGLIDTWVHLAQVIDRRTQVRVIYADAVQVYSGSISGIVTVDNARELTFGASDTTLGQYYAGLLSDVRFYNRALDQHEIQRMIAPATKWQLYEPVAPVWVVGKPSASGSDLSINVSSSITVSESYSVVVVGVTDLSINVSSSITVSESYSVVVVGVSDLSINVSSSITVSESYSVSVESIADLVLNISSSITVSESYLVNLPLAPDLGIEIYRHVVKDK